LLLQIGINMIKLCFGDVETLGLDEKKNPIVQIAMKVFLLEPTKKLKETHKGINLYIQPFEGSESTAEALKLAKKGYPEFFELPYISEKKAFKELIAFLDSCADKYNKDDKMFLVGYNTVFDDKFLRALFERNGNKYFGSYFYFPYIDVMQIASNINLFNRNMFENFKLEIIAKHYGIEPEGEYHDAMVDVDVTHRLFSKLMLNY
jgi:DNA polymerase-3 subunit epsilon